MSRPSHDSSGTSSASRTSATDAIEVRPIGEAEIAVWNRVRNIGFLRQPAAGPPEEVEVFRRQFRPGRLLGGFDEGRCVATLRSFAQEVTAVGGAAVQADAITNATVSPTHRRRGILSRMMSQDLAAAKERGDVVSTLIASEYPIYGRYGFGPATHMTQWEIDASRTGLDPRWSGPADGARIDLVDAGEALRLGPELHERARRTRPGFVSRDELWWPLSTGDLSSGDDWTEPSFAVHRDASGEVQGMVAYGTDDAWDAAQPHNTAEVEWLLTSAPEAERDLWHYLCSIDKIAKVKTGWRAPDDLLPLFLPDPRAARVTGHADSLWVRILDVVRALEARTYDGTGSLVLEITDRQGLAGGRYRLDASPDGASCAPTDADAELTLGVSELAMLWLGDVPATRLAALGRVREERAGAARMADALLYTSGRPWCPDIF